MTADLARNVRALGRTLAGEFPLLPDLPRVCLEAADAIDSLTAERDVRGAGWTSTLLKLARATERAYSAEEHLAAAERVVEAAREVRRKHPGNGETADLVLDRELRDYEKAYFGISDSAGLKGMKAGLATATDTARRLSDGQLSK